VIIGVSQTIQFKRRDSRLGELLYVRIFISAFELIDICIIVIIVRFWLNLCVSGKFPETAWRAIHSRQAVHVIICDLGSWTRNRLAARSRPPGAA